MDYFLDDDAVRAKRRWWGAVTIFIFAIICVLTYVRIESHGSAYDRHVDTGMSELVRAIEGDEEHFSSAEESFREASVISFLDDYPVFLLSTTQRIRAHREGRALEVEQIPEEFFGALALGDFEAACHQAARIEHDRAAEYAFRLCRELDRRESGESVVE